jgi:16S rRNA (adenine1518-N6/adenine1519-N6)-dimethyltransferase
MEIRELQKQLAQFRIRPDKRLGQNFLLSDEVLEQIVSAADLGITDEVLEIGPGLGFLTRRLADKVSRVYAVEKDRHLALALRKIFRKNRTVTVIQDDGLFFVPGSVGLKPWQYKLVANLPYYITGKILQVFLTAPTKPSLMVLMVQKEVGERLTAQPGQMSLLSVSAQFYSNPEIIGFVPKQNFYPQPEVDSAIVRLQVLPQPRLPVDEAKFFQLVKISFANKRKQLHNNLMSVPLGDAGSPARPDFKQILADLGLSATVRPQELSVEDWGRLYARLFPAQTE